MLACISAGRMTSDPAAMRRWTASTLRSARKSRSSRPITRPAPPTPAATAAVASQPSATLRSNTEATHR
jgi:hypothetical protein